jgi:hypothetical protein
MKHLGKLANELPLLGLVVTVLIGVALAMTHRWRAGIVLSGIGLICGAAVRATLPDERVGMLVVRGRLFDVLTLAVAGGTLVVLAESLSTTA